MAAAARTAASYAKTAVCVHVAVSGACTVGFYSLLARHYDVVGVLSRYGAGIGDEYNVYSSNAGAPADGAAPEWEMTEDMMRSAMESITANVKLQTTSHNTVPGEDEEYDHLVPRPAMGVYGRGSMLAMAFMCTRAVFAVRAPLTVALTPVVRSLFLRARAARAARTAPRAA